MDQHRSQQPSMANHPLPPRFWHFLLRCYQHPQAPTFSPINSRCFRCQSDRGSMISLQKQGILDLQNQHLESLKVRREDYYQLLNLQKMINRPITLIFEPLSIDIRFEKCLKLQIAIFRLSSEQTGGQKKAVKMDKTDPVKYTNPNEKIMFNKPLNLLTTIPFNTNTNSFENKEVDFEMAVQIDGRKERMGKKLDLKDIIMAKGKQFKYNNNNPLISLTYRAEVKLEDDKSSPTSKKVQEVKKHTKVIRFEDNVDDTKQNLRSKKQAQTLRPQRIDKGRYKTVFFQPTQLQLKIQDSHSEQSQMKILKKYKSLDKVTKLNEIQSQEYKTQSKNQTSDKEGYVKEYKEKIIVLEEKCEEFNQQNSQLSQKIKEKQSKIMDLTAKCEQLQSKLLSDSKQSKRQRQQLKKQFTLKSHQDNQTISNLKQQIKVYQSQIQKSNKTAMTYQQSTKNIASGSQSQIRILKEQISHLQRQKYQIHKQYDVLQQSFIGKDQVISELKNKIYSLDKENMELSQKLKSAEIKIGKVKEEYQFQIEDLQQQIKDMKEDNKNLKIATLKDIKDKQQPTDYKKKYQNLQKQFQRKKQQLKKITDMKKQLQTQKNAQISSLKKQIQQLKESLDKRDGSHKSTIDCADIEMKIQLQKLKKQLDTVKKTEKALLIEKGKLQSNNRSLQQDIVKNKCSIANILNAVQETGNQKLITEVYNLTE